MQPDQKSLTGYSPRSTPNSRGATRAGPRRARAWLIGFMRTPGRLEQFLRYTFVSAVSLGIDIWAFALLISATVLPAALAGALSCMAGLVVHYLLSVTFVFSGAATGKNGWRLFVEYMLTGAMGFAVTAVAILLVTDVAGLPALAGKGVGIGATFVSVYLVRAGFVFAPQSKKGDETGRALAGP